MPELFLESEKKSEITSNLVINILFGCNQVINTVGKLGSAQRFLQSLADVACASSPPGIQGYKGRGSWVGRHKQELEQEAIKVTSTGKKHQPTNAGQQHHAQRHSA